MGSGFRILTALFLAEMTVTFETSMIYAAVPTLIREFGGPMSAGWLISVHLLLAAATGPVVGRLGDIWGRKRVILILLALALVGSVLSAVSNDFAAVLIGRGLQGLAATVLPLSIGILRKSFPEERIAFGIGVLTASLSVGAAMGLVLGGMIVDQLGWQPLFVASAALLAVSVAAVALFVPDQPGTPTRHAIDWLEALLPIPAIGLTLFTISRAGQSGWFTPGFWANSCIAAVLFTIWARRSLHSAEPFIDLRLFRNRNFAVANGVQILISLGCVQFIYVFSAYVQSPAWTAVGLGLTATASGFAKLPSNVLSIFAGPLVGWLTRWTGDRTIAAGGALLATLGWIMALYMPTTLAEIVVILCLISFGTTVLTVIVPNVIVKTVPEGRTSEALGTMSVTRGMAGTIGAQLIAMLLSIHTVASPVGNARFPAAQSYLLTAIVVIVLTVLAAMLAYLIRTPKVGTAQTV